MTGYKMQSWGTACTHPPQSTKASPLCLPIVECIQLLTAPIWAQNPNSLPTKVLDPITKFSVAWAPGFSELSQAFSIT